MLTEQELVYQIATSNENAILDDDVISIGQHFFRMGV